MATTETELQEETNVLDCPICTLKLRDPKELECRCVFCSRCIENYFRSPTQEHAKCPACKSPSKNPPELKDVSNLLEKLIKTNLAERYTCESPGCKQTVRVPYICIKCQLWLCNICKASDCPGVIKDVPARPGHETCASKHVTPELNRIFMSNKYKACSVHDKDIVSYCEKCHDCVCEMCRYIIHPHHDLVDIAKKADLYMNMMLGQGQSLKKKIQEHEKALLIYREIVHSSFTPQIISKEQCTLAIQSCQQKAAKCDCLLRCITQLNMFGSKEAILIIGYDIQKDIEEELNIFPLNDITTVGEWWRGINKVPKSSDTTEQDRKIDRCVTSQHKTTAEETMDDLEQRAKVSTVEIDKEDSGKDSSSNIPSSDETSSVLTKDKSRTIQTRASVSKTIPNNDHGDKKARTSATPATSVSKTIPNNDHGDMKAGTSTTPATSVSKAIPNNNHRDKKARTTATPATSVSKTIPNNNHRVKKARTSATPVTSVSKTIPNNDHGDRKAGTSTTPATSVSKTIPNNDHGDMKAETSTTPATSVSKTIPNNDHGDMKAGTSTTPATSVSKTIRNNDHMDKKARNSVTPATSVSKTIPNNDHRDKKAGNSVTPATSVSKTIPNNDHRDKKARSSATPASGASGEAPDTIHPERAATAGKGKISIGRKRNISKVTPSNNILYEDQKAGPAKSKATKRKRKSSVTVKWTMQTRSCALKANSGDDLGDQGGSKAKRARTLSFGDRDCSVSVGTARTGKGSTGTFQSVSMSSVRNASFTRSNSVDEAKAVIAQVIGHDPINIDIVDNGQVTEGGKLVGDIQRPLQVVVHNTNRQVPVTHQTQSPDIVNDWEEGPRVKMSCGHAITPDNLYRYCWSQLGNQRSSFRCFADVDGRDCSKEWFFVEVAEKACLSNDEHFLFESRINRNWINHSEGVRECPFCRLVCERQDPANACVNCLHCKRAGKVQFTFCWYCLDRWTVKHQCKKGSIHQMLSQCERKEIVEISGCPSIRACPECKSLIMHTEGCKHMTCMDCRCTFCFVCLGVRGNEGFACGSYDSKCDVAPIQSVT